MKAVSFKALKEAEARKRMADLRAARRSPRAAAEIQRRVSLVGSGAKWHITNFREVARAMAQTVHRRRRPGGQLLGQAIGDTKTTKF